MNQLKNLLIIIKMVIKMIDEKSRLKTLFIYWGINERDVDGLVNEVMRVMKNDL